MRISSAFGLAGCKSLVMGMRNLLRNLVRFRGEHAASDVGRVACVRKVGHHGVPEKYRCQHGHIVHLTRGLPGIVGEQHVAGSEGCGRIHIEEVSDPGGHCVDVPRSSGQRLGDHVPARIEDAAGEVLRLAHNRAEGGPHQRELLFVTNREQAAPENLESDGVRLIVTLAPLRGSTVHRHDSVRSARSLWSIPAPQRLPVQ